jgi:hypothetical protein
MKAYEAGKEAMQQVQKTTKSVANAQVDEEKAKGRKRQKRAKKKC